MLDVSLDVALSVRIKHMWMTMLLKQIKDRIEPIVQLVIALSRCQGNDPKQVNRLIFKFQLR
jgi:hypothetical protein